MIEPVELVAVIVTGILTAQVPPPASKFYRWLEKNGDRTRAIAADALRPHLSNGEVPPWTSGRARIG